MTGEKVKRAGAPAFYPIHRKEYKWAVKPSPGPHPADWSFPITIILREILGYATNLREVKYMLNKGYVKVDGKIIRDYRYPVGLMDVIELVPERKFLRMLPHRRMKIYPVEISREESRIKPLRVKVKKMIKGGVIQFTFHDGRCLIERDVERACQVKPGDTLVMDLLDKQVIEHAPLKEGYLAIVIGGSKIGFVGTISKIEHPNELRPKIVHLVSNGADISTIRDYVFPIGKDKPAISLAVEGR